MATNFTLQDIGGGKFRVSGSIPGYGKANQKATDQVRRIVRGAAAAEALRDSLQSKRSQALLKQAGIKGRPASEKELSQQESASARAAVRLIKAVKDPSSILQLVELGLKTRLAGRSPSETGRMLAATHEGKGGRPPVIIGTAGDSSERLVSERQLPPPALIEAAAKAGQGGVIRILRRDDDTWEIHNPLLVDLRTAAAHLGCSIKTVQRKACTRGIPISHDLGARINLRSLVSSLEAAAT